MSQRRLLALQRDGKLLCLRASVKGLSDDVRVVRLLVDTGSSFTVLPLQILDDIGCRTLESSRIVSVMAASGLIQSPILFVPEFNCLGQQVNNFPVVAFDVPFNPVFNGILGIDFLAQCGAVIDTKKATISVD